MDYQDKISSYIENELTAEGEQEFLISLAASETLRRSFRSELTMKKILRQDDQMLSPPRDMRSHVFSAIGIGAVSAPSAATQVARGFFASKVQTFMSALALVGSMAVGYVMHGVIQPSTQAITTVQPTASTPPALAPPALAAPAAAPDQNAAASDQNVTSMDMKAVTHTSHPARQHTVMPVAGPKVSPIDQTNKPGDVFTNPVITPSSKK